MLHIYHPIHYLHLTRKWRALQKRIVSGGRATHIPPFLWLFGAIIDPSFDYNFIWESAANKILHNVSVH